MNELEKIQDQINDLREEATAKEGLIKALPTSLPMPYLMIWNNSSLSDFTLNYKVQDLNEAVRLIKDFWGVYKVYPCALWKIKGTFTSFRTYFHKREKGEETPVFPVTMNLSRWGMTLVYYVKLKDYLIKFVFDVKDFQKSASIGYRQYRPHTRVSEWRIKAPALKDFQYIKWHSDIKTPSDCTIYWTWENIKKIDDILRS